MILCEGDTEELAVRHSVARQWRFERLESVGLKPAKRCLTSIRGSGLVDLAATRVLSVVGGAFSRVAVVSVARTCY